MDGDNTSVFLLMYYMVGNSRIKTTYTLGLLYFFICDLDLFFTAYLRQKRHIITHKISRCLSMK